MRRLLLSTLIVFAIPFGAAAETPEEKGLAIAKEAQKRNEGWVDSKVGNENDPGEQARRKERAQSAPARA